MVGGDGFEGGWTLARKLEKLCNELLCNCFVIAKRIEPLPPSPQPQRSVGAKIIYRRNALKRLAGFRVEIDLFSSFVFLFLLTRLCYIFYSLFLWLGVLLFFFSLISFLYSLLQLRYFTTHHHDVAALQEVSDWSLSVFYAFPIIGRSLCHCNVKALVCNGRSVTHHQFAIRIKSLSNRWSQKLDLKWIRDSLHYFTTSFQFHASEVFMLLFWEFLQFYFLTKLCKDNSLTFWLKHCNFFSFCLYKHL